jgi:hypothetical protein
MSRCLFGCLCICALGVMALVGCSETTGDGGGDGTAGDGGSAGDGGTGGMTGRDFPCTEQGIRDAIAEGGGPHTFDCVGPQTVVAQAEIVIDNDVVLDGGGKLTVSGNEEHRVFSVPGWVTVELVGLAVIEGFATGDPSTEERQGGGIYNNGTLTLTNCTVSGNTAVGGGGRGGGGVYNNGTLTLTNGTVSGNTAPYGGGILSAEGVLTLTNSTVSGNDARGGIVGIGGGILNVAGPLTLTNSTVSGNTAEDLGGGIFNDDGISKHGTVTLTNSTVSGNTVGGAGGGILNHGTVTLTNSTVSGNTADSGGGIANDRTLTLTNSTVSGNTADNSGGGMSNACGTVTLTNSTVSGNTVVGGEGGGIHTSGTLTLTNGTVSDNAADSGSAIYAPDSAGETCPPPPIPFLVEIANSLIRGDCAEDEQSGATRTSIGYNIESPDDTCGFDQGTDLVNITEGQLDLGPLADNGGPTMTHALGVDSVAIDHIPAIDCEVTEDQRGVARPQGPACDVGAFELEVAP